jgi:hypothetical protein
MEALLFPQGDTLINIYTRYLLPLLPILPIIQFSQLSPSVCAALFMAFLSSSAQATAELTWAELALFSSYTAARRLTELEKEIVDT